MQAECNDKGYLGPLYGVWKGSALGSSLCLGGSRVCCTTRSLTELLQLCQESSDNRSEIHCMQHTVSSAMIGHRRARYQEGHRRISSMAKTNP